MRRTLLVLVLTGCTRSPESSPPVVAVGPAGSAPRIETTPAPAAARDEAPSGDCRDGFVEVVDGPATSRFVLGRELANVQRGAKHAYVEEVIHPNGETVLHLEGIASADGSGGHLSLTVLDFADPKALPATFEHGYVEYVAPGSREWRRVNDPRVEISKWGAEGEWVEGTFGPGTAPPVMSAVPGSASSPPPRASSSARPPPRMIATVPYRGRFRICRSKDWHVRH